MKNKKFIIFVLALLLVLPVTYAKITNDEIYGVSIYGDVDVDNDNVWDSYDNLLYNATYVTTTGVTELNITIGGNHTQGSFNETHEVIFYDQTDVMVNFTYNFTDSALDLSKVVIEKALTYIIVNFSGQLKNNKTLFLEDNSFVSLCVKNAEINSISEMSAGCTGSNEIDFTTCLGNNTGVNVNGVICRDNGTRISVQNLSYSAIRGTLVSIPPPTTPPSGGGGGTSTITKFTISEERISVSLKQGETSMKGITITNNGGSTLTFSITNPSLEEFVRLSETSFSIAPGKSKTISLDFLAREDTIPDLYLGKLLITSGGTTKEILVSVEVESKKSLFDVSLEIPEDFLQINRGDKLFIKLNLYRIESKEQRVDVELEYRILNSKGKVVIFDSDTVAVETSLSLIHEFDISQNIVPGEYQVYVKAIYKGDVGSATSSFEVVRKKITGLSKIFILLIIILSIFITLIIFFYETRKIKAKIKKRIDIGDLKK